MNWLLRKLSALCIVLVIVGAAPCVLAFTANASEVLDYPWANASDVAAASYEWGYASCPSSDQGCMSFKGMKNGTWYGEADPWKYYFRNCTSYVAWKLSSLGVPDNYITGLGNGGQWYDNAGSKNISRGATPQVGDAAIWPAGTYGNPYGHVAYVEAVNANGTITVSEYNYSQDGTGDKRTATALSMHFTEFVHFAPLMSTPPGGSRAGGSAPPALTGASPIQNGGFNQDVSHWSVSGSANLVYNNASTTPNVYPYEGTGFAATNASQSGDSISETTAVGIGVYDTWCVSARVVTIGQNPGSGGTLALWLLGPSNDVSTVGFNNLPGANAWQEVKTCVMATGARQQIKVQFYPAPSAPTMGIDAVDVHQTLNTSGGYNNGNSYWNLQSGTNLATYTAADNVGTNPYEGRAFAATNTSQQGGSFLQDIPRNIGPGDTFCAEAQVVTVGNSTGASGALAIYLTGASPTEQSTAFFGPLPGGSAWLPIKTCVTATTGHSMIRVQMYPAVNGPTLGVDALDVHATIMQNGGLNGDSSRWSPNGSLGYANFQNFSSTMPYEGSGFEIVQTNAANSSLSQSRRYGWGAGDTFCAEATVVTGGEVSGGGGTLALWLLGQSNTDVSTYSFSALPGGNAWTRIKTCVMARTGTNDGVIKVEIYPSTNNLPLGIDAIDVH